MAVLGRVGLLRPAGSLTYNVLRIRAGRPGVGRELSTDYIPLELGLWDEVSFTKGCYTGQEIVSKMSFVGHPPHGLLGLKVQGTPAVGSKALKGETIVGTVTSAAPGLALMVARWERTAAGDQVVIESEGQKLEAEVVALPMAI